jgi:hypothetical protein
MHVLQDCRPELSQNGQQRFWAVAVAGVTTSRRAEALTRS